MTVNGPDGKTYTIEGATPDSITPEEARQYVRRAMEQGTTTIQYQRSTLQDRARERANLERASQQNPSVPPTSMQERARERMAEEQQGSTNVTGVMGEMARGAAPVAAASLLGGAGVAAAAPAMFVTDLIVNTVNNAAGTNWATTRQAVDRLMDELGVEDGDTAAEQLIGLATQAASGARSVAELAQRWSQRAVNPLVQNIGTKMLETFSARPNLQAAEEAGSVFGEAALRGAAESMGAGPTAQAIAGLGGGILGGGLTSAGSEVADTILSPSRQVNAQRVPRPGEPRSDYTTSERRNLPIDQGGERPTAETTRRDRWRESVPGGSAELQYRRYNENQQELTRFLERNGIEIDEFGNPPNFARSLMEDFQAERGRRLSENVEAKNDVLRFMSTNAEPVPTPNASQYLDEQLSELMRRDTPAARRLTQQIVEWQGAIDNKDALTLESTRKDLLAGLQSDNNKDIRSEGTQILNEAYSRINEDIGEFIRDSEFGEDLYNQWRTANANLSSMARDFSDRAFVSILDEWDKGADNVRPEVIIDLLESTKLSDAEKLYRSLSDEGREIARLTIASKLAQTTNTNDMSPTLFAQAAKEYGDSIGVFFDEEDVQEIAGMRQHFNITRRSEGIVRGERGDGTSVPTGSLPGAGTAISMGVRQRPLFGLVASAVSVKTLGRLARTMEEMPHIRRMLRELATLNPDGVPARNLSRLITQATAEAFSDVVTPRRENQGGTPTREALTETQLRME